MPLLFELANYLQYTGGFQNFTIAISLFLTKSCPHRTAKKLLFSNIFQNRPYLKRSSKINT